MGIYDNKAVGLDLSHYDENIDAAQLAGNVDFLTIKAGGTDAPGGAYLDARFAERVQMAYDIGALCGAYWFVNPRYWLEKSQTMPGVSNMTDDQHPLLQTIMQQLKNKLIHWLAFDVEDNSLPTSAGQVTDVWIKFYISDLVERITRQQGKGNMRPFKMGVYSRRSFIDDPAKPQAQLSTYLGVQPDLFIWTANWVNGTGATFPMSQIYQLRPSDAHIPYSFGYSPARPLTWQFFQWSGDGGRVYKSPAITSASGAAKGLDLNLFNGTVDDLKAWAGVSTDTGGDTGGTPPIDNEALSALLTGQSEIKAALDALRMDVNKPRTLA